MKTRLLLPLACVLLSHSLRADNEVYRTWTDTQGRKLEATFRGIENGQIFLQVRNGYVYRIPLDKLTPADQEAAKTLKPEGLGIPADPNLAQAAARIDMLVDGGLKKAGQKPNPLASDEQFVRRVFLDLAGRIPTREETLEFINDTSVSKRAKVIDRLLNSPGFASHLFNYFSDMLRMADVAQKARFYTYQDWFKSQLADNVPWDQIVYKMMTADGKLLENGATGYLLRDAGMRLDNLSLTLSTFLGANVSCAQCHDHPFAEWTQHQFYEMAAFFGATETFGARGAPKGENARMMRQALASLDNKKIQQQAKNLLRINSMAVEDTTENDLRLPDDYKYPDAKPGDPVKPKLVTWSDDKAKKAYQNVQTKNEEELRVQFAKWMTSPDNPRFAMTIANRMWKRVFGLGVKEPVTDLDDPASSVNPPLLHHLGSEMVRLKFDLKQFMRLLCNTQAYQREATSHEMADGTPYLFPGPILRRMTAEQAWDSCATLVVGADVDKYREHRGATYAKAMNIDFGKADSPDALAAQIENAMASMRQFGAGKAQGNPKNNAKKKRMMQQAGGEEEDLTVNPPVRNGLVLARASELPQPEKDQHFLRMFGQSDRQIADSSSEEGSIPQVMMLMNGEAQRVIGQDDSLVVKTAAEQKTPDQQVESLYLSFFSRKPRAEELKTAVAGLESGMTMRDLTWVLFNTREFMFVE
ncbi:DUF1549 domain-containing protein [Prosthecobacter sp.]|jgi:hypothetical protein|uniref:DUF1549 domain-containing protein n=1 Tax=Prosthecobacter sp. TaxID=1965333 RepID=UPI0037837735